MDYGKRVGKIKQLVSAPFPAHAPPRLYTPSACTYTFRSSRDVLPWGRGTLGAQTMDTDLVDGPELTEVARHGENGHVRYY